jgi:methionyl-tRNA formyltransferase
LLLMRTSPEHRLLVPQVPGTVVAVGNDGVVVACKPGALRLQRVKAEGRHELNAAEWARGARVQPSDQLGIEHEAHA